MIIITFDRKTSRIGSWWLRANVTPVRSLDPGDGLARVDGGPRRGTADKCAQPFGNITLCPVQPGEEDTVLPLDVVRNDIICRDLVSYQRLDQLVRHLDQLGRELH